MKHPNGRFFEKPCRCCGKIFQPEAPSHLYCSAECKKAGQENAYYMRNYGVPRHVVKSMLEEQDHLCAICGEEGFVMPGTYSKLVLDHCHDTGAIRQMLCHNCNRALGLLQDDPERIRRAATYIEVHREGATTIPEGSRPEAIAGRSAVPPDVGGEDIVWTRRQRRAAG